MSKLIQLIKLIEIVVSPTLNSSTYSFHEKYFYTKLKKYALLQHFGEYLGYIIYAGPVWADPYKPKVIQEWPVMMCVYIVTPWSL